MGAWGYNEMESDGQIDWIENLKSGRTLAKEIKKAFMSRRPNYDDIRAAAVMIGRGYKAGLLVEGDVQDLVPLGIQALDSLVADGETHSFDEPARVNKSIRKQVEGLVRLHENLPEE